MITGLLERYRSRIAKRRLAKVLRAEAAETFLEALMAFLKVGVRLDRHLRRSLDGFDARYQLKTRDGLVDVGVVFEDGRVDIQEDPKGEFDATMLFRDSRAVFDFFASTNPDLLGAVLEQTAVVEGNLNYVYRLAYMARHLQLEALGRV